MIARRAVFASLDAQGLVKGSETTYQSTCAIGGLGRTSTLTRTPAEPAAAESAAHGDASTYHGYGHSTAEEAPS